MARTTQEDASSSFSQLHIGVAGGPEEVPVGVWPGDRRVAWVGVNGLEQGLSASHGFRTQSQGAP